MDEQLIKVENNENPTINLEIGVNTNPIDIKFAQSMTTTIIGHNDDIDAHEKIIVELNGDIEQIGGEIVEINTALGQKADKATTYSITEADAKLAAKLDSTDATVTKQGNTFNEASKLVMLDSANRLPAVDGSLLLNTNGTRLVQLGTISTNTLLQTNAITVCSINNALSLTLPTALVSGIENTVIVNFTTTISTSPTISTSGTIKWSDKNKGQAPSAYLTMAGVKNILTFKTQDGGITWHGEYSTFGTLEIAFTRPNLTANGTLGGSSFAVYASISSASAYSAVDGSSSTRWEGPDNSLGYYTFYNPNALKVSQLIITNMGVNKVIFSGAVYGSNDNSNFTLIKSFTNSEINSPWLIDLSSNTSYYKYHKVDCTSYNNYGVAIADLAITATYLCT